MSRYALIGLLLALAADSLAAVETLPDNGKGISLGREQVQRLMVGLKIKAGGPCRGVIATVPVPMDWPEQEVKIVDESFSSAVKKVDYRVLDGGVKQLLVTIPRLEAGEATEALLTVEIRRHAIVEPKDPSVFTIPTQPDRTIRKFLAGSPFIESRNAKIRACRASWWLTRRRLGTKFERSMTMFVMRSSIRKANSRERWQRYAMDKAIAKR